MFLGEEYFRETPNGLARYVRPHRQARPRLGVEELDPLKAMQMGEPNESGESENEETDAEVQADISLMNAPTFPAAPRPVIAPMPIPQGCEPPEQVPEKTCQFAWFPKERKERRCP